MLISESSLSSARATLAMLHSTIATHERLVETTTPSGDTERTWTPQPDLACRVETSMGDRSTDRVSGPEPADRPVYDFTVFAAHDADVRLGDRITANGVAMTVALASHGQSQPFVSVFECSAVSEDD